MGDELNEDFETLRKMDNKSQFYSKNAGFPVRRRKV